MMHPRRTTTGGFSLIETIVYIALFIGLSALLIDSLIVMSKSYMESRATRDVVQSAEVSVERIEREVRSSTSIDGTVSQFDVPGGLLSLKGVDDSGAAETLIFSLVAGQLVVAKNGGSPVPLTDPHVSVDSLVFRHILVGSTESVRIEATFRSLRSAAGKTVTIDDTALVRTLH